MPNNIGYPVKNRSIAAGKPFPAKSRSLQVDKVTGEPKPTQHGSPKAGKAPKKGVLMKGGGHG